MHNKIQIWEIIIINGDSQGRKKAQKTATKNDNENCRPQNTNNGSITNKKFL